MIVKAPAHGNKQGRNSTVFHDLEGQHCNRGIKPSVKLLNSHEENDPKVFPTVETTMT